MTTTIDTTVAYQEHVLERRRAFAEYALTDDDLVAHSCTGQWHRIAPDGIVTSCYVGAMSLFLGIEPSWSDGVTAKGQRIGYLMDWPLLQYGYGLDDYLINILVERYDSGSSVEQMNELLFNMAVYDRDAMPV